MYCIHTRLDLVNLNLVKYSNITQFTSKINRLNLVNKRGLTIMFTNLSLGCIRILRFCSKIQDTRFPITPSWHKKNCKLSTYPYDIVTALRCWILPWILSKIIQWSLFLNISNEINIYSHNFCGTWNPITLVVVLPES